MPIAKNRSSQRGIGGKISSLVASFGGASAGPQDDRFKKRLILAAVLAVILIVSVIHFGAATVNFATKSFELGDVNSQLKETTDTNNSLQSEIESMQKDIDTYNSETSD